MASTDFGIYLGACPHREVQLQLSCNISERL
jgi:hypothetical protein